MSDESEEDRAQRLAYAAWCEWQLLAAEAKAAEQRYHEAAGALAWRMASEAIVRAREERR